MKSIQQWLDEYGESHRNKTNKTIHWVCVPAIVFSLLALLWGVPLPGLADLGFANAATALGTSPHDAVNRTDLGGSRYGQALRV